MIEIKVIRGSERKRRKPVEELFRRKEESRTAGLSGKEFEKYLDAKSIHEFFKKRYGVDISDVMRGLRGYGAESDHRLVGNRLVEVAMDPEKYGEHYIIFPKLGSIFKYYFARGILNELRQRGLGKNIKLYTLVTYGGRSYSSAALNKNNSPAQVKKIVNAQMENMSLSKYRRRLKNISKEERELLTQEFKDKKKTISIMDYVDSEMTVDAIRDAFNDYGFNKIDVINTEDKNAFVLGGGHFVEPANLMVKTDKGKAMPIANYNEMLKRGHTVDNLYKGTTFYEKEYSDEQIARIGDLREMFFYFGRAYFRLFYPKQL